MGGKQSYETPGIDQKNWVTVSNDNNSLFNHVNTYAHRILRNLQTN